MVIECHLILGHGKIISSFPSLVISKFIYSSFQAPFLKMIFTFFFLFALKETIKLQVFNI